MECKNPVKNKLGTITLDWNHPDHGWIPFTASPKDEMQYGREIYDRAMNGEYGKVMELPKPSTEELKKEVRSVRNELLYEFDVYVSNQLRWNAYSDEEKSELETYHKLLKDIPTQAGFPNNVVIPKLPAFLKK